MNRIVSCLSALRSGNRKAMGIFITCGFPALSYTVRLMEAIDRGGADFIELGMPFSDPLAEGKPIQHSSEVALAGGTTLDSAIEATASFRRLSDTPVLLMGYVNPILRYGVERFCASAASAGVDGLILPDLPPEESAELSAAAASSDLALVSLIAPNTPPERIRIVEEATTGFVYAVSMTALTGTRLEAGEAVQEYLSSARTIVKKPLLVGFGISNAEDAARMVMHTDGFIVGSALVREIDRLWADVSLDDNLRIGLVESFVRSMRPGIG